MAKNTLIIGDTHEPFCHPKYRQFCYEVANRFQCSRFVHIGDEVDNHAISYHEADPNGHSAGREAELAQKALYKWYADFPNMHVCIGNHSALHKRKGKTAGLPDRFLKSYQEAWDAPKGWKWDFSWEFPGWVAEHGTGSGGQMGALNRARDNRISTAIGHLHSFGGVMYSASERDNIFGLNVGCGIDIRAYAMAYGRDFKKRPTLGCGVVLDDRTALFIPMNLGSKIIFK